MGADKFSPCFSILILKDVRTKGVFFCLFAKVKVGRLRAHFFLSCDLAAFSLGTSDKVQTKILGYIR
jgi:hypothetical protein